MLTSILFKKFRMVDPSGTLLLAFGYAKLNSSILCGHELLSILAQARQNT